MEIKPMTWIVIIALVIAFVIFLISMTGGGAEGISNVPLQASGGGCGR